MKRHTSTILAGLALGALASLSAQDLTITNARIIGAQRSRDRARIDRRARGKNRFRCARRAVRRQRRNAKTIDAKGMTAMPGFIDGHRHINTGPNEKAQMQALLEAGYTTVLSGGGPAEGNITLRDHIDKGLINGPRIIPSGSLRLANNTPEMARAAGAEDGRDGNQVHGRDRPYAHPGAERKRNRKFSRRWWTKPRRSA